MAMNSRLLRPTASGFNPKSIAGLAGWWDANDASTITLNGGNVSQWNDKSGAGRNVSQGTALNQPEYLASSLNGKAGINWGTTPGTAKRLSRDSVTMTARDHFVVADFDGGATFANFEGLVTSGGSFPLGGEAAGSTVWRAIDQFDRIQVNNNASSNVALPTILNPFIVRATRLAGQSTATALHFGQFINFGNRGWAGKIYEIIIYDSSLSAAQAMTVKRYLSGKWGIALA